MTQSVLLLLFVAGCSLPLGTSFMTTQQHGALCRSLSLLPSSRPEDIDDVFHPMDVARTSSSETSTTTRRNLLAQTGGLFWMSSAVVGLVQPAHAAAPITTLEADSFLAKSQRLIRPKPPKALRPKLDQDFAVLLMRSSYNALDELDCVAMVRPFVGGCFFVF